MNEDPHSCQKILALLANRTAFATIGEVIQVMQDLDNLLLSSDGLKWFNLLYLRVTQAVYEKPPADGWGDQKWLTQLDITFARLYFDALASSCIDPTKVPRAWMALFEARDNPGIERVQFALAGINAHINHDLPLASVQTGKDMNIPPDRNSRESLERPGKERTGPVHCRLSPAVSAGQVGDAFFETSVHFGIACIIVRVCAGVLGRNPARG